MEVDDRTVVSDDELQSCIERMLALVQGLESAHHHCSCGALYRLGMSDELQAVIRTIRRGIWQRTGSDVMPDSRWLLLEID